MKLITLATAIYFLVTAATADVLHLKSGGTLRGTVLQETPEYVTIAMQYGTAKLDREDIASIEKTEPAEPEPETVPANQAKNGPRLPVWSAMVQRLAKLPWATGLSQIPATVIDKGAMRNVPYTSYRCGNGGDYEVNIYGDPDTPAGIEIGVYGKLTNDAAAKRRCVEFVASVLPNSTDAAILRSAQLDQDKIERAGMTIEITPPTAEDAYGGWWVSVYYEQRLEQARATDKELNEITIACDKPPEPVAPAPSAGPKRQTAPANGPALDWTPEDVQKARRPQASPAPSSSGGRVYVRGYYRKNGTYVHGYWRRK